MRTAAEDLLLALNWRALAVVWVATMVATAVLVAAAAPPFISVLVLGGLAASLAVTIERRGDRSRRPGRSSPGAS